LYKSLAWLGLQFGHRADAVKLAGLGLELHQTLGFVPPVKEQEWWEDVMAKLQGELPKEQMERLLAEGAQMDMAEAIKLVEQQKFRRGGIHVPTV
jgi:hypothetical protein